MKGCAMNKIYTNCRLVLTTSRFAPPTTFCLNMKTILRKQLHIVLTNGVRDYASSMREFNIY